MMGGAWPAAGAAGAVRSTSASGCRCGGSEPLSSSSSPLASPVSKPVPLLLPRPPSSLSPLCCSPPNPHSPASPPRAPAAVPSAAVAAAASPPSSAADARGAERRLGLACAAAVPVAPAATAAATAVACDGLLLLPLDELLDRDRAEEGVADLAADEADVRDADRDRARDVERDRLRRRGDRLLLEADRDRARRSGPGRAAPLPYRRRPRRVAMMPVSGTPRPIRARDPSLEPPRRAACGLRCPAVRAAPYAARGAFECRVSGEAGRNVLLQSQIHSWGAVLETNVGQVRGRFHAALSSPLEGHGFRKRREARVKVGSVQGRMDRRLLITSPSRTAEDQVRHTPHTVRFPRSRRLVGLAFPFGFEGTQRAPQAPHGFAFQGGFVARTMILKLLAAAVAGLVVGCSAAPTLTLTGPSPLTSASPVTVAWGGAANASDADVVQMWVVPAGGGTPRMGSVLLGFFNATASGSGSRTLPQLFNPRFGALQARYLAAGASSPAAVSAPLEYSEPNEPLGVHLALTGTAGEMRVRWSTRDELAGGGAVVQYGASADKLTLQAASSSPSTYSADDMCGAPANLSECFIPPGYVQNAVLPLAAGGLSGRTVYYRVGAAPDGPWSRVFSFRAPPAAAGASVETALVVYGDQGVALPLHGNEEQQPAGLKTAQLVKRDLDTWAGARPSAVALIGDISYSRGHAKYHHAFMQAMEPVMASAPFFVSYGNHEYDDPTNAAKGFFPWRPDAPWANFGTDSGGECGRVMEAYFDMPDTGVGANVAYSFEVGNVHVALFSAEHDFLDGSKQRAFLEADLAAVDRSVTPWLLVGVHRPMYSSSSGHTIDPALPQGHLDDQLRASVEPLLQKYEVDVFLAGHVHTYERSCSIAGNFTCAGAGEGGTVHLVVGSGGNDYNPDWAPSQPHSPPSFNTPGGKHHAQPDWSVFRTMNNGYSRILTNATHLTAEYVGTQRGEVHDTLVLERKKMVLWS